MQIRASSIHTVRVVSSSLNNSNFIFLISYIQTVKLKLITEFTLFIHVFIFLVEPEWHLP